MQVNVDINQKKIKPAAKLLSRVPEPVIQSCRKLQGAGHIAWLAGGCVRDLILGREPRDWDVVTDAPLDTIKTIFPKHLDVGVVFGIVKLPPIQNVQIDIAIFRKEEGYTDRRHPDVVTTGSPAEDAARRDFTINALYLDLATSEMIDFFTGAKDLDAKILRSVGDPNKRFSEDALRVLRAVRLSGQLGFKIEKTTAAAVKKCAPLLKEISRERVRDEVFRLLATTKPVTGLEYLAQLGLWEHVFGIKRTALPADYRNIKITGKPEPIDWVVGIGICGLAGDICAEPKNLAKKLTELLRLSRNETKLIELAFDLYTDSAKTSAHTAVERPSPERWVELATERRELIEFLKSFVRRARGPTEVQKDLALAFLEQALRWARSPKKMTEWPNAQSVGSAAQGAALGKLLNQKHWETFWTRPKLDF